MTPSKQEILSAGGEDAAKFRDHVGEAWHVRDFREVVTKNGPSVLFDAAETDNGSELTTFWAPSVVAGQLKGLKDAGYLPGWYRFQSAAGKSGRTYFTLAEVLDDEAPDPTEPLADDDVQKIVDVEDGGS